MNSSRRYKWEPQMVSEFSKCSSDMKSSSSKFLCGPCCFLLVHWLNSWFLFVHCSNSNMLFKIGRRLSEFFLQRRSGLRCSFLHNGSRLPIRKGNFFHSSKANLCITAVYMEYSLLSPTWKVYGKNKMGKNAPWTGNSCPEVEEEGRGRVRRHPHGPRPEQDWPRLTVRDRPVSASSRKAKKAKLVCYY